jgi:hypothetical protein
MCQQCRKCSARGGALRRSENEAAHERAKRSHRIDKSSSGTYDPSVRIVGAAGLLIVAIVGWGVIDNQPTMDTVAGVSGVVLILLLVAASPYLTRLCKAEDRFWVGVGRGIRRFTNRIAKLS